MMKHLKLLSTALIVAFAATGTVADTGLKPWPDHGNAKRPYIFTQQHNVENRPDTEGRVQLIRLGYPLQVQLPGNPAIWSFQPDASEYVEYRGLTMVYSPNRIDGTESLLVFDLALSDDARHGTEGYFMFITEELPAAIDNVVPGGVFVVRFQVIDPQ